MTRVHIATLLLFAAMVTGGSTGVLANQDSHDEPAGRELEGTWQGQVTILDCTTKNPIFGFLSMDIYLRGGGYLSESSSPPPTRATGMGEWRHVGGRRYASTKQFFTYDSAGFPTGVLRVSTAIRLNGKATAYSTDDTFAVYDLAGNFVEGGCGKVDATRLP